jgi:divinyl protochlorophyllide a 8-vinyl-reductase
MPDALTPTPASRIGPNAAIQLAEALVAADPSGLLARAVFEAAGLEAWLTEPPGAMVDERAIACLHQTARRVLPADIGPAILAEAGRRTGDYILAHRIPAPARLALRALPAGLAAKALTAAIAKHAWTFAGSGRFEGTVGRRRVELAIAGNPVVAGERADAPVCHWHAAVFARLYGRLVHRGATAEETACQATGADACRFTVRW